MTCRSAVDSLVSGLVFPFRTISVLDVKPDTESTSSPASPTTEPEAVKTPLEFKGQLFETTTVPPSEQKAQVQPFARHKPVLAQ